MTEQLELGARERPLAERLWTHLRTHHEGEQRGATCRHLAGQLVVTEREVRKAVTALRLAGRPLAGHPATGYFVARTPGELRQTCAFLRTRAMHSLRLEAGLRNVPLAELMGQMALAEQAAACDEGLRPARLTIPADKVPADDRGEDA